MVETLTLVATMIVGLNLWRYWGSQVSFTLFLQLPLVIAELLTTGKLPLVNYLFDKKNTSARNYNFWIKSHWVYQYITQRGGKWRGSNKWITKVDREIVFLFFFFFFFFASHAIKLQSCNISGNNSCIYDIAFHWSSRFGW